MTFPPSLSWAHLVRDLVATGAAPLDLSVDRLQDLLVLTDQIVTQAAQDPDVTTIRAEMAVVDRRLELNLEADGAVNSSSALSEMVLGALADEHWERPTDRGLMIGFAFAN